MNDYLKPIHPGEILVEDYLIPSTLSMSDVSAKTGIPVAEIVAVCSGSAPITDWLAIKLAILLETSAEMWTGLQKDYNERMERYLKRGGEAA